MLVKTRHRLEKAILFLTGARHGIGEAEARLFTAEGARAIVVDIRLACSASANGSSTV
jgi:NADP-dependent 3-hydroxy acid dehydrogenase YdfG